MIAPVSYFKGMYLIVFLGLERDEMLFCIAQLDNLNKITILDDKVQKYCLSKDPEIVENEVQMYRLTIISPKHILNEKIYVAIDDMAHFTRPYFAHGGDAVYIRDSNGNPMEAFIKGFYWHILINALVVAVGDGGDKLYDTWEVWDFSNQIKFREA